MTRFDPRLLSFNNQQKLRTFAKDASLHYQGIPETAGRILRRSATIISAIHLHGVAGVMMEGLPRSQLGDLGTKHSRERFPGDIEGQEITANIKLGTQPDNILGMSNVSLAIGWDPLPGEEDDL